MRTTGEIGRAGRVFAALVAMVALGSLLLQYVLLLGLVRESIGSWMGTLRYFSYFTILSNVGVLLVAVHAALASPGFFASARGRGALALYIGVTGAIYFLILRHLWQPQGAQWWADTGLHYASPLLYWVWWLGFVPHGALRRGDVPRWLLFPLAYLAWALLRGEWVHEYPYPFIDVGQIGWSKVARNALGVLAMFVAVGGLIVWLDGRLRRRGEGRSE
ncbi:MAG TPA: Pr6Pr family membrane protein [Pseudoxanthomonas sp.]|nr:Pr6Pr family membrane protein [Pseudoxanthomonas sp.]